MVPLAGDNGVHVTFRQNLGLTAPSKQVNMRFEELSPRSFNDLVLLVTDHVTAMLAYWDRNLICRFANNAYYEWFNKTREEMIDRIHISELLGPLYEKNLPYINNVLAGRKQVFEREIPLPDGSGVRHSLATYIPDIVNGQVIGFFVHVADITHVKNLENEILKAKREMLRNMIATGENNNRYLVETLRESIAQRLAACKLMMEERKDHNSKNWMEVNAYISETILEINTICEDLTPSEIEILGLVKSIDLHLNKISVRHHVPIEFKCQANQIEQISLHDKLSIFRILQSLIKMYHEPSENGHVEIELFYNEYHVNIYFTYHGNMVVAQNSKLYLDVEGRVEYHGGTILTSHGNNEVKLAIDFLLAHE